MCRTGGRRCPSNHDSQAVANRNARRRAAYGAARKAEGKGYEPRAGEALGVAQNGSQSVEAPSRSRLRKPDSWLSARPESDYRVERTFQDEKLKITVTEHAGELVDSGAFASRSFTGKPNWDNLDGESYASFGFTKPSVGDYPTGEDLTYAEFSKRTDMLIEQNTLMSQSEVSDVTDAQRTALNDYSNDYTESGVTSEEIRDYLNDGGAAYPLKQRATLEQRCGVVVPLIDSAISDLSTSEQRIVYRGTALEHLGIGEVQPDESVALGTQLRFDSYQSSSADPMVAKQFLDSGDDDVILEISTPAGLNITSIAEMANESETLLPRGAHYVVVGEHWSERREEAVRVLQLVAVNENGELLEG